MSKLFAFHVSATVAHTPQEGQYDSAAQMWVGTEEAVASFCTAEYCFEEQAVCERTREYYSSKPSGTVSRQCTPNKKLQWCFTFKAC